MRLLTSYRTRIPEPVAKIRRVAIAIIVGSVVFELMPYVLIGILLIASVTSPPPQILHIVFVWSIINPLVCGAIAIGYCHVKVSYIKEVVKTHKGANCVTCGFPLPVKYDVALCPECGIRCNVSESRQQWKSVFGEFA